MRAFLYVCVNVVSLTLKKKYEYNTQVHISHLYFIQVFPLYDTPNPISTPVCQQDRQTYKRHPVLETGLNTEKARETRKERNRDSMMIQI